MNKLLIADDERIERQALKYVVERVCPDIQVVDVAVNGRDAIEKVKQYLPDILFMDIQMPGITGLEAAKIIKEIHPECKIIFISAFNYFHYAQQAIEVRAMDFILKPISNEQVADVIQRATQRLAEERKSKEAAKKASERFDLALEMFENKLLISMVNGRVAPEQLEEYLHMMNKPFYPGFSIVVQDQSYLLEQNISLLLDREAEAKKILTSYLPESIVKASISSLSLLLIPSSENQYTLVQLLQALQDIHQGLKNLGIHVMIGVGDFQNIEAVNLAFTHAKIASNIGTSTQPIVFYRELTNRDIQVPLYPFEKEQLLSEKIKKRDLVDIFPLIDEIINWIDLTSLHIDEKRTKAYSFLITIIRLAIQSNDIDQSRYYHMLQEQYSLDDIQLLIKKVISEIIGELDVRTPDKTGQLIESVCEYINKHYSEEIRLEDMASKIHYSSYYFSKMFKLHKQQTFVEYITSVRVAKAKELMTNVHLSIKEISNLVGYDDQNYFTRVFKRIENMTPTEYRDKIVLRF